MAMELLAANLANTTTLFTVSENTSTIENILNIDTDFQYYTSTFDDDNTTATMTINFAATVTINRIALLEHNLKSYTIFYNGLTANTFTFDSAQATTTSDFLTNSETSQYFRTTSDIDCTSVTIDLKSTMVANQNKFIGYLALSELKTNFENRVPPSGQYDPILKSNEVVHKMADGGLRIQAIDLKYQTSFSLEYVTTTLRDTLKALYDARTDYLFCPFGTSTSWDGLIYPCVWVGDFNFFKYSDNASTAGHSGSITLAETPD